MVEKGIKKKITNPNYRKFLDEGIIKTISEDQVKQAMKNIKGRYKEEGEALLILLYYTGCRPIEALEVRGKDVLKEGYYIIIKLVGSKGGLPRSVYLKPTPLAKRLYKYASSLFPEMFIFYDFKSSYKRRYMTKKGEVKMRIETTSKIYYYVKKWFKGVIDESISPYFLRHNRFSKLAENGVDLRDIRLLKGSRGVESVNYYVHMSTKRAKDIARKIK